MNDALIEDLDRVNKGEVPSPFGEAQFVVMGSPASVQSKKIIRKSYLDSIRDQFKDLQYILTGEIMLDITWLVSAKNRYETDSKSDIDNCIKPIIDAFTGPNGFFIDDCQIRGLYICWRHIESEDERVIFDFKFQGDQYSLKEGLAFIQLDGALCTPVNLNWPKNIKKLWAKMLINNKKAKVTLEELGISYPSVAGFLAGNQPFHRTRVNEFQVISLSEFSS